MADLEELVLSISADTRQMQRALDRLTGDVKKAGDGIDSAFKAPKIDDVAKSLGKTRFETANLAAQFQDIAVQLQGGQSPFTVALQQGTQISQVLGRQGAGGVVALLGSAFQSLLSPVSLVTIGIIALGGAAVQYAAKAIGAVGDLDDKLKTHGELIKSLKDAYGEAGKGIDTAVKESAAVLQTLLGLSTDGLQKQFVNLSNSVLASITTYTQLGDAAGQFAEETSPKFSKFASAIDAFRDSAKNGTPDVTAFRASVAQIADSTSDEKVKKLAQELLDMTSKASEAQLAIEGTAKALRQLSPAALEAAEQGEKFKKALDALSGTVSPDLTDREKIIKNYNKALEQAAGTEERVAASRAKNDQLAVLSANEQKKAAEEAAKTAESNAKRFESALNSTARNTAAMNGKVAAEGLGAGALARLETESRLTEAAQQSLGKVTTETAAKIKAQAEAAGQAADALARSRVNSQIDFGRQTAFLTPQDLQIAQQLRGIYGNDVPAALASSEAAALRLNQALNDVGRAIQGPLVSGLADVLDGTKSVSQGFSDMGKAIVRALEEAIIKMTIVAPLMRSLQQLAGGFLGGDLGNALPSAALPGGGYSSPIGPTIGANAAGTDNWRGGLTRVNEQGGEILNLPSGTQIIPHDVSMAMARRASASMPSVPISTSRDSGNTQVNVNIKNYSNEQATVQQKPNGNGGIDYEVVIGAAAARQASMPGSTFSRALDQRNRVASR